MSGHDIRVDAIFPKDSLSFSVVKLPVNVLHPLLPLTFMFWESKERVGILPPSGTETFEDPSEKSCQLLCESVVSVFDILDEELQEAKKMKLQSAIPVMKLRIFMVEVFDG